MARHQWYQDLHHAGERFVDAALKGNDSLLTRGQPIWTPEAIDELFHRYVELEDTSKDTFTVKLQRQLDGVDDTTRQLAAEWLFVHLLMPTDTKGNTKRTMINGVLALLQPPVTIPEDLDRALDQGIAHLGAALAQQGYQLTYLLQFMRVWKSLPSFEREAALADPWAFKALLYSDRVPMNRAQVQREALLYLVFMGTFEPTVSVAQKRTIATAFQDLIVEPTDDVDRQLLQIRRSLSDQYGKDVDFYDPEVRKRWDPAFSTGATGTQKTLDTIDPENTPAATGGAMATGAYDALLATLEQQYHLHLPVEVVSNYLLAMQSKRFVILTGISGTGKTQLALAVARYFRLRVRRPEPTDVPPDTVVLEVTPDMRSNHRKVLPAAFVADLMLPPLDAVTHSGPIIVQYPGGEETHRVRKDDKVTTLYFNRGAFRTWFDANLQMRDRFLLQAVDGADGMVHALRISVPETHEREVVLDTYEVTAVRPDWTDNRGLLGYYNPLTGRYAVTPFLELLLRASEECEAAGREGRPPHPFFAILDEMNLARVEHYFSDFLSCLESGEPLVLHDDPAIERGENEEGVAVPRRLAIPENLYFTGTVNVDETTYMFSPKVLDRAFTIELNEVDLEGFGLAPNAVGSGSTHLLYLRHFSGTLAPFAKPSSGDWTAFGDLLDGALRRTVIEFNALLAMHGRHFGYRVANEIARFVLLAASQAGPESETLWAALDLAILEKALPKFHGTQQELGEVLASVFSFAFNAHGAAPQSVGEIERGWTVSHGRLTLV